MDPDQAQCLIGPDIGPNCLQRLSADNSFRQSSVSNLAKNAVKLVKVNTVTLILAMVPSLKFGVGFQSCTRSFK